MAKRRGNNEGSIHQRSDGRWQAIITVDEGKRKYFYGKTRQEVARRLSEALHELDQGLPLVLDERQTVGQYLAEWHEIVKSQIRGSSWRRYGDYVRVHLIPGLGKIPLTKLTAQHVQMFYARKLAEGLSGTTVHMIHGVLHRALKDALQMGLVQRNVTEMVRPPRRNRHEMGVLTEQQAAKLLTTVKGDRFEALYVLAITTGMRLGELLALHWRDLDLDQAWLQVRWNVQEASNGHFILAEPKTPYSRRRIALTPLATETLRQHRIRQEQERASVGEAWDTQQDLVFPNMIGGIMIPDNLTKRSFKHLLVKAGLSPTIRFHDLRHTAATLLLGRGVNPKVVSEMLGHADISITLGLYGHVLPHMQQMAVGVMESLFAPRNDE